MKKALLGFSVALLFTFPLLAYSAAPSDMLKEHVNRVLGVLRDSSLKGESGKKMKREKIRSISEEMFDFTELSKRSLGRNWARFNPGQQEEFIKLFKSMLETAYVDKIASYTDEKILFKEENTLSEKAVEIPTVIVTKSSEIPIHYRLFQDKNRWKVYDVAIDGVSLVSNYRSSFSTEIKNDGMDRLIERLAERNTKGGKT